MNIGELKAAIKWMPDDIELVGDFSGSQQDVWKLCCGRRDNEGIYKQIHGFDINTPREEINFMICIGE